MVTQAVILAGGLGTRLRPITYRLPKSMVDIGGEPFLSHLVRWLGSQGIERVLLCIGYLGEVIERYFGDGAPFGVRIEYAKEQEPMGTGGALKLASPFLHESFVVLYGDSFVPIRIGSPASFFSARDCLGMITVYENRPKIAENNVRLEPDGRITCYDKTSSASNLNGVEAGVTFLRREALNHLPPGRSSMEQHLFPQLIRMGQLIGYPTPERFWDIGTPEGLEAARRHLCDAH
ncbi:MAG: sugar phosphate nucleotidyltransferase [Candidatus Thermoplasmatota archaeon]